MIVQVSYRVKWQFKEHSHYKISTCKKIINCKTGKIIKCTKSGGSVGYFINGIFFKKSDINTHIEVIPKKECCPF
jgi:hypothetical protein